MLRLIHGLFRRLIWAWYRNHRRDLPWRRTRDPYKIMVSEVMLQQTQVSRVREKYKEFLRTFPTLESLARAKPAEVIRAWSGLGYNRRAIFLHRAAKEIVEKFDGKFPRDVKMLRRLPGLGPTTAAAISAVSFDANEPVVDTNVRRVLSTFFPQASRQARSLKSLASTLVPKGKNREWTYALFDFGAMALKRNGDLICPLHRSCRWVKDMRKYVRTLRPARSRQASALASRQAQGVKLLPERSRRLRFEETDRYFRGRIVEMARKGSVPIGALTFRLRISRDRLRKLLLNLQNDSLITISKGRFSLPS